LAINRKMAPPTMIPTDVTINAGAPTRRSRVAVTIAPTIDPTKLKVILSHFGIAISTKAINRRAWVSFSLASAEN
jgi:hypothetical protein